MIPSTDRVVCRVILGIGRKPTDTQPFFHSYLIKQGANTYLLQSGIYLFTGMKALASLREYDQYSGSYHVKYYGFLLKIIIYISTGESWELSPSPVTELQLPRFSGKEVITKLIWKWYRYQSNNILAWQKKKKKNRAGQGRAMKREGQNQFSVMLS